MRGKKAKALRKKTYKVEGEVKDFRERIYLRNPQTGEITTSMLRREYQKEKCK